MPTASLSRFLPLLLVGPALVAQTKLESVFVATVPKPVFLTSPPGDEARQFVVTKDGRILVIENGRLLAKPFLDVTTRVNSAPSEGGLLCLAFHPKYAANGHFYVVWTRASDDKTEVRRFTVSESDPNVADPTTDTLVFGPVGKLRKIHNGGCLGFGRDGYLYIALGDGGGGLGACVAQDLGNYSGKILRIDIDSTTRAYDVPPDNPYLRTTGALPEIWSIGLRNPWRFGIDRVTGDIWIADVGEGDREEVNRQPGTSKGGENYGWNIMEGSVCTSTPFCPSLPPCRDATYFTPTLEYAHTTGCSVTGGFVYRGCAIPDLRGAYFYGDFCRGRIWSVRWDGTKLVDLKERTSELAPSGTRTIDRISSFGQDGRGELYVLDYADGEIYRIAAAVPPQVVDLGFGKPRRIGPAPRFDACGLLTAGNSARFRLDGAPASSIAWLMASNRRNDISIFGGTVVPNPVTSILYFVTDAQGRVSLDIAGGNRPFRLYVQFVLLDSDSTFGIGFSNALEVRVQ